MIGYICVGTDDVARAERFYSSFLLDLGYRLETYHCDLSYILKMSENQTAVAPDFYVKAPFNGAPASAGNGSMVAFEAQSETQVRNLYARALASGGVDEGKPGFRTGYSPDFYVCYFRDPDGNKIALYACV